MKKRKSVASVDSSTFRKTITYKIKPNVFTYELVIEVDDEHGMAALVGVRKSKIDIGVQRAINNIGKQRIVNYVGHALKEHKYNPKEFTVEISQVYLE